MIDTGHTDYLSLIAELARPTWCIASLHFIYLFWASVPQGHIVDDLKAAQSPGTSKVYAVVDYPDKGDPGYTASSLKPNFIGPQIVYTYANASNDYFNRVNPATKMSVFQQLVADASSTYPKDSNPAPGRGTPWPLHYVDKKRAAHLDSTSLNDYIDSLTSFLRVDRDGSKSALAQTLKVAYVIEFGASVEVQSALNLVYLNGFQTLPNGSAISDVYPAGSVPTELFEEVRADNACVI